jgi:hypothetical protein
MFYFVNRNMFIFTPILDAAKILSADTCGDAFKLLRTFLEMCCVTFFQIQLEIFCIYGTFIINTSISLCLVHLIPKCRSIFVLLRAGS